MMPRATQSKLRPVIVAAVLALGCQQLIAAPAQTPGAAGFGSIAGRILGDDGSPVAALRVAALSISEGDSPDSQDGPAVLGSIALTDEAGRYLLADVPTGRYFVVTGPLTDLTYLAKVQVAASGKLTVGDSRLSAPLVFSVRGRVVREANNAGESVLLVNATEPKETIRTPIRADGTFEFPAVRPGAYFAGVVPMVQLEGVRLTVNGDVRELQIPIPLSAVREVRVEFEVSVEGGGPLPLIRLPLIRDPAAGISGYDDTVNIQSPAFSVNLPPGEYKMPGPVQLPAGYAVKSIQSDSTNLLKDPLNITGFAAPIRITLSVSSPPPWRRVEGRLTSLAALSVRPRQILLQDPALAAPLAADIGPDGRFEFPMALPGTYLVAFEPSPDKFHRTLTVKDVAVTTVEMSAVPPLRKVSGRITEFPTARTGPVRLTLLAAEPPSFEEVTTVMRDGSFVFDVVEAGRYDLFLEMCPSPSRPLGAKDDFGMAWCPTFKAPSVTVADRDVTLSLRGKDLVSMKVEGRSFRGRITVEGKPVALRFWLLLVPSRPSSARCGTPKELFPNIVKQPIAPEPSPLDACHAGDERVARIETLSDGTFSFSLIARETDDYDVTVGTLPFGAAVHSFVRGDSDLLKQPLRVLHGSQGELLLDLTLDRQYFATVSGRVKGIDPSQTPVVVILTGGEYSLSIETAVKPDGTFTVSGVPQGLYSLALGGSLRRSISQNTSDLGKDRRR